jgi:hypothetical protein
MELTLWRYMFILNERMKKPVKQFERLNGKEY